MWMRYQLIGAVFGGEQCPRRAPHVSPPCVSPGDLKQEMLEDAQNKLMNLLHSTEGKVDK